MLMHTAIDSNACSEILKQTFRLLFKNWLHFLPFSYFIGWAPAVREGPGWNDFIEFDFLGVARINKLVMGLATEVLGLGKLNRKVTRIKIQYSFVPNFFTGT